jgi:diguanylate cyclase (GGDEF)-like protein
MRSCRVMGSSMPPGRMSCLLERILVVSQKVAGYLVIGTLGLGAALLFDTEATREIDRAAETYRAQALSKAKLVEASVRLKLDHVYQGLRTISLLPSVKRISRHAESLDQDSKMALRQLYNNLASNISISEIYIVPRDLDPAAIDPVTGKPEEPILMMDEAIGGQTPDPTAQAEEGNEFLEYLQLREHNAYLRDIYPSQDLIDGLKVPFISGPAVITCDDREYKVTGRDVDRQGIILSVPFYGDDGALKGTISAIVRSSVLSAMLPTKDYAIVNTATGFLATPATSGVDQRSFEFARRGLADPALFFSRILPLGLSAPGNEWHIWIGQSAVDFLAGSDVEKISKSRVIGWFCCLILVVAALIAWRSVYGRKEAQLEQWQNLSTAAMEGLILVNDDTIETTNSSFRRLIGESASQPELLSDVVRDKAVWAKLRDTIDVPIETTLRNASGDSIPVAIASRQVPGGIGTKRVLSFRDLRERKEAEEKIRHLARHDRLTQLVNLTTFHDRLEDAFKNQPEGSSFAILSIDLDHFKRVNDTLGHPVGDKLLQRVASVLTHSIRKTDTVARVGGDEFIVIQIGAPQPYGAMLLADRIVEALSDTFEIDGHSIVIGASVGIAFGPDDGKDAKTLIANADLALYKAKTDGKCRFRMFEPELDQQMRARRSLEADLRVALGAGQFELNYQPIVNALTQKITGFEALLRWRHPVRGLVSPADFIPMAETMGLMSRIGAWVLQTACAEAMSWPSDTWVAVNVSPIQFKDRTVGLDVAAALGKSGLPPSQLRLEITEGVLLENTDATFETLHGLRELGVRIAMDDFGTGYSSLSYLSSFQFDTIKIDRSFIRDRATSKHSEAVVRAVIGLGGSLGMSTTAEGIETIEQLERLRLDGCTEMQGFLFSKPVPASEIPVLLKQGGFAKRREAA